MTDRPLPKAPNRSQCKTQCNDEVPCMTILLHKRIKIDITRQGKVKKVRQRSKDFRYHVHVGIAEAAMMR